MNNLVSFGNVLLRVGKESLKLTQLRGYFSQTNISPGSLAMLNRWSVATRHPCILPEENALSEMLGQPDGCISQSTDLQINNLASQEACL